MHDLPDDLVAFLNDHRQFDYDPSGTSIGRVTLKSAKELSESVIEVYAGCQKITDDPYADLDGHYEVQVVDLIADSEDYQVEGLFCWISRLRGFGSVDAEHGSVLTFPNVSWSEIARNPIRYLDAQWFVESDLACQRELPWLHFRFRLKRRAIAIETPPEICPIHGLHLSNEPAQRADAFKVYQRRELENWLSNYLQEFPCSGLPIGEGMMRSCSECRKLEEQWYRDVEQSITPTEVKANIQGWVLCPGCGVRFSLDDPDRYCQGIHMSCGQKILVVT